MDDGWCVQAPQLAGVQFNRPNTALGVQPTLLGQASCFFLITIDLLVTLFSFRVAPTSTSSTSLAVDQVFLFMKPSYLYQNTQVGIYDNKQKHRNSQHPWYGYSFHKTWSKFMLPGEKAADQEFSKSSTNNSCEFRVGQLCNFFE